MNEMIFIHGVSRPVPQFLGGQVDLVPISTISTGDMNQGGFLKGGQNQGWV